MSANKYMLYSCTGVDSSGQQIVVIRSNTSTTTTTTTTSTEVGDTPMADTDSANQPQISESADAPQDGLAALVDAALSSQRISKSSADLTSEMDEGGETDEGGEEMTSDDPDWKGSVITRDAAPRKRRPKRRRGDDPDLEQLEESTQVRWEFCLFDCVCVCVRICVHACVCLCVCRDGDMRKCA